jgi:hypothetical protein
MEHPQGLCGSGRGGIRTSPVAWVTRAGVVRLSPGLEMRLSRRVWSAEPHSRLGALLPVLVPVPVPGLTGRLNPHLSRVECVDCCFREGSLVLCFTAPLTHRDSIAASHVHGLSRGNRGAVAVYLSLR